MGLLIAYVTKPAAATPGPGPPIGSNDMDLLLLANE